MVNYGMPVPAVAVKARTRRNLAAVGLLIVIGMVAVALTHDDKVIPSPRAPLMDPCARVSSRFLCPWVRIDFY